MNTKNKIIAILMAGIVAMAVGVPMAIGDTPTTSANVNDIDSTYDCTATSITVQPNPTTEAVGTVSYSMTVSDDNGGDTVPAGVWTAVVNFGTGAQTDPLTAETPSGLTRAITGTGSIPANTAAGGYIVSFKLDGVEKCTDTVTVTETIAYSIDFNVVGYGSINPGSPSTVTGDAVMQTPVDANAPTIKNDANVVMDVQMSIADAGGNPETLFEGNTAAVVATAASQPLTTTPTATTFDVNMAIDATAKIDSTLSVPTGIQAASYSGTLTVTGVKSV